MHEGSKLHEGTKMHEDYFVQRVKIARLSVSHGGSKSFFKLRKAKITKMVFIIMDLNIRIAKLFLSLNSSRN